MSDDRNISTFADFEKMRFERLATLKNCDIHTHANKDFKLESPILLEWGIRLMSPTSWLMNASASYGVRIFFCLYFLASLAQYSISRLETTQVRSSRAVYETYEWNDALLIMTPTLTPSQNRPHPLCASQHPRTRSACIDAHGRDITQHKHRHPLCIHQTSSQHDK